MRILLAKKGIRINAKDKDGATPLHWAAESGNVDIVKILLEKGARVDAVDNKYRATPLHGAAQNGHIYVVKVLLEKYADPLLQDGNGKIPRNLTCENGIRHLLEKAEKRQLFKFMVISVTVATALMAVRSIANGDIAFGAVFVTLTFAVLTLGVLAYKSFERSADTRIHEIQIDGRRSSLNSI